jgi:peptide/nickel transport system permease protein
LGAIRVSRYLIARALALLATLAVASVIVFALVDIAPGDPAVFMLGLNADPQAVIALRAELGLDAPPLARYFRWIAALAQGDLGVSYTYRVPVAGLVAERAAVSLPLALIAMALSTALALGAALLAVSRRGAWAETLVMGAAQAGVAAPNFWVAMLLVLAFATGLGWFPAGGFPGWEAGLGPALNALVLPAVALALPQAAILARVLRAALVATLSEDYVRTARAKGLSDGATLVRHALPNALIPTLTILGLQFSFLIAGAVIIENVFYLPGLGRLVFQAITQRDLIVVRSVVMLLVLATIVIAFAVEALYALADPRIRRPS